MGPFWFVFLAGVCVGAGGGILIGYWLRFERNLGRRVTGRTIDLTGTSPLETRERIGA